MKAIFLIVGISAFLILCPKYSHCASMDELSEQYNKQYEALKPPAYSSVRSDYVFEQTALATQQTTKILELIYQQNRELLSKYDETINRFDEIIRQNNEIIKLLSKNGAKDEPEK